MQNLDIDILHRIVEAALKEGASYSDIRYEELTATNVETSKGYIESAEQLLRRGVGIRVLYSGAWGFASTEVITKEALLRATKSALKMAKVASSIKEKKVKLAGVSTHKASVSANVKKNPAQIDPSEKAKLVLELDKFAYTHGESIKDVTTRYRDSNLQKIFVSSEGAEIQLKYVRTYLVAQVVAKEGTNISPAYETMGGVKGYEIMEGEAPFETVKTAAERAVRLLTARVPRGGHHTVVLDNKILALIVHEAFGHTAEADLVITGSVLTGKIGRKVASELVTIVDDPGPEGANGWTPYDDEGVKARRVVIVDKGVLMEYMQSRETAAELGMEPTGNARAQDYTFAPIVRMRNTYMLPGDWEPEEIIAETRHGYYLKGAMGGQADANGDFMFNVQEAWLIENGELKEAYRGATVSGNALDVLGSIDAVGKDLKINFPGTCGKWQLAPVDGGGPHIRCKIIVGGAR